MWLILSLLSVAPSALSAQQLVEAPPAIDAGSPAPGDAGSGRGINAGIVATPSAIPPVHPLATSPQAIPPAEVPAPAAPAAPTQADVTAVTMTGGSPETSHPGRASAFEIRFGGLLQVEYLGVATEGHVARRLSDMAAPLAPLPPNAPSTPFLDESTLILRRARLSAEGFVATPRLGYFVEVDAGQGSLALLEYRMRLQLGARWTLTLGQMRVPFSRSWAIREDRLLFPERSIATDQFRYDYDIGISVDARGLQDRLTLTLAGFNGGGRILARNDNLDPMLVLRIEGQPIGEVVPRPVEGPPDGSGSASVTLGAALSADYVPTPPAYGYLSGAPQPPRQLVIDANDDGLPDGITVLEAEIDLKASLRGFAAEAEGYYRHEAWHDIPLQQPAATTSFSPRTSYGGFFAQAFELFQAPRLVAGLRLSLTELSPLSPGYQRYDQHTCLTSGGVNYACSLPYSDEQLEVSAVLVKRVIPRVLQVSGMYSFFYWSSTGKPAPSDPLEHRAIVVVQLSY
jgi:hypothetical protein